MARLRKFRLFRSLPGKEAERLAQAARLRKLARNELFLEYGDDVPGICIVLRGSVVLSLGRGKAHRVFRVVGAGESFLEAPTLTHAASPFEIRALEESVIAVLPMRDIEMALKHHAPFALELLAVLADRTMLGIRDLYATTLPIERRVANYLDSLARPTKSGAWQALIPVTKTMLAARLGMKKESLSRVLRALSDAGLILVEGRRIVLLHRAARSTGPL